MGNYTTIRTANLSKRTPAIPVSARSVSRQNQRSPRLPMELIVIIAERLMQKPLSNVQGKEEYDKSDYNFDAEMVWTKEDIAQYERQQTLYHLALCSKATLTVLIPLLYRAPIFFEHFSRVEENVPVFMRNLNNEDSNSADGSAVDQSETARSAISRRFHPLPLGNYIQSIRLSHCKDTAALGRAIPLMSNLTHLEFYRNKFVCDSTIAIIAKHCPNLTYLGIKHCTSLTKSCIPDMIKLKHLSSLSVHGVAWIISSHPPFGLLVKSLNFVDQYVHGLEAIVRHTPHVERLDISRNYVLSDDIVQMLVSYLPALKYLNIGNCSGLTIYCIDHVLLLNHLEELNLIGLVELPDCIAQAVISKLPKLKVLRLCRTRVTDAVVEWMLEQYNLWKKGDSSSQFPRNFQYLDVKQCPSVVVNYSFFKGFRIDDRWNGNQSWAPWYDEEESGDHAEYDDD